MARQLLWRIVNVIHKDKSVRLFFALWPNQPVRDAIVENLQRFEIDTSHSRLVSRANLHMTLHFIGNTSMRNRACLDRQARRLKFQPFDIAIDCHGVFSRPKVLWFGCQQAPAALFALQKNLGQRLESCGFTPEQRPYRPHISAVRKISHIHNAPQIRPIEWRVDGFALVQSTSMPGGVYYEVIERYQ